MGAQEKIQTFRGRYQNFRRVPLHPPSVRGWGVAAPGEYPCGRKRFTLIREDRPQFTKRIQQIPLDVIVESLERGYIQDACSALRPTAGSELIQCPEKCGECLAASGGSGDEHMLTRCNKRPGLLLDIRRSIERVHEPSGYERVKLYKRLLHLQLPLQTSP